MFTKRSFITLATLTAAMVAHAGSIQVTETIADLTATTPGGSELTSFVPLTSYLDANSSYSGAAESSVASAKTSYSFNGTTLSGYAQATSAASAGQNGTATALSIARNMITFNITSRCNVSLACNIESDTSLIQEKGGVASGSSGGVVSILNLDTFAPVATFTGSGLFSSNVVLEPGSYFVEVVAFGEISDVTGGSTTGALASSHSYGSAAYCITATPVPEPTSMAVLACGAVALLRRRKKA